MAPVLQCPDCGQKHPLAKVPQEGAFPCQGCGRVLKVPEAVGQRAAVAPAAAATAVTATATPERPVPVATAVVSPNGPAAPDGTRAVPELDKDALGALGGSSKKFGGGSARLGRVPMWMRFLLWVVAVPLGFLIVFAVARTFNLFTSNQLSDLFLANNAGRFWPAARLLPFVALVTASLVQGGVYGLARLRGRKAGPAGPELSAPRSRTGSRRA